MKMQFWDGEEWSEIDTDGPEVVVAYDINVMICSRRTVDVMMSMNDCLLPAIRLVTCLEDKPRIEKMHENWRRRESVSLRSPEVENLSQRRRNSRGR